MDEIVTNPTGAGSGSVVASLTFSAKDAHEKALFRGLISSESGTYSTANATEQGMMFRLAARATAQTLALEEAKVRELFSPSNEKSQFL